MFLHAENISGYLMSRGILTPEEIVKNSLAIQEDSRRNRNFRVFRAQQPGLFVKQVPIVVGETVASIQREASFYQLTAEMEMFAPLRPFLLRLHDYDARIHTLTLDLLPACENITQIHLRLQTFPSDLAASLGRLLGLCHLAGARFIAARTELMAVFPKKQPWLFTVADLAESVFGLGASGGTRHVVAAVRRNPTLCSGLRQVSRSWRLASLSHGDIKWDNFVVARGASFSDTAAMRIVDWELCDLGDPSWDVGALLASYLQHWIVTMSADASQADDIRLILGAPHDLRSLWPALSAFWLSYARTVGLSGPAAATEWRRHVEMAGARLVLTAFEIGHPMTTGCRTGDLCLQLAAAVFADPDRAGAELFGLGSVLGDLAEAAPAPAEVLQ